MIVAEIGHNFQGDMQMAFELIRQAKYCGSDVAKFQLYDTGKIVKPDHRWYYDLKRGELSKIDWMALVEACGRYDIEFMASAFDVERVGWCEEAGMKRYKIASRSIYDVELLEAVVATKKPIIMSLGKVKDNRIPKINSGVRVDYLYCVAQYPAPADSLKLSQVDFRYWDGFSDHSVGIEACMVAVARGAKIIEKHLTLDKNLDGCDHVGSMTPDELSSLVDFAKKYEAMK